ncbi:hypothetical protein NDU88_007274 [Pleurodeles waltl]|uniref:Uncharacterized protein n=1 Tax=Pleurodeles waltl TaxID=8319 RepID=A0AAV7SS23_PLEWA|nr:hypothetical protein NDU88_007274 [Pleurodeles waltl]
MSRGLDFGNVQREPQQNERPGAVLPGCVSRPESRSHRGDLDIGRRRPLHNQKHGIADGPSMPVSLPAESHSIEATDRILQEIATVGCRLEAIDAKISDLTVAYTSIQADIAGFQETVTDLN